MIQRTIPLGLNSEEHPDWQLDGINDLGGEPLDSSGFEAEEAEPDYDERS